MLHDARFMTAQIAANDGAMGFNSMKEPSLKMLDTGNYKKGRLRFYGLEIAIENPAGTYRDAGKKWRVADHYGYIRGFKGADGDDVDCFVGGNVSSKKVYVINQSTADGITFDEHKVMLGYDTPQQAMLAYQLSYDQGWHGLSSMVEMSVKQLRFWLERGNKSKPVIKADLPSGGDYEIPETLAELMWHGETPSKNIDDLLFAMRRTNAVGEYGNLLLDAATMEDLTAGAQLLPVFDALVSQFSRLKPKMETLQRAMAKKSELADPTADIQISDPFKRYGSLQVSVLFTLTDGQTVSVFFHNPDATPNKILPTDSMVSWKWMLNKKDVTIVVAPEMGKDVPVAEVANRVMQLAQKNAPAFAKAQENKGERVESIKALRTEISTLEQKEVELKSEIATFKEISGNEVSSTPIQEQPEVVNANSEPIQSSVKEQPATEIEKRELLQKALAQFPELNQYNVGALWFEGDELQSRSEYDIPQDLFARVEAFLSGKGGSPQENKENNNIDAMKYFENPIEMTGEQLADKFFRGEDNIFREMVLSGFSTATLNSKISSMIHKDAGYYSTARSFVVDGRIVSIIIGTTTDISKDKNINAPFYIQVFDAATNKKSPKVQFGINNEPYQIVEFVAQQARTFANEHGTELSGNFPSYESMSPKAKEAVTYVNEMQSKGYKSRAINLSGYGFGDDVVSELIQDYVKGGMSKSIPFDYNGKAIDYFGVDGKPTLKYDVSKVSMSKQKPKTASEWMNIASSSAAVDDVRTYLVGTHISPDGKMVSTDGHRITVINGSPSDFNAVIESAGGIPKDDDLSYKTKHDDGYTIDNNGNFVAGTFPEWQRLLPREPMSQSDIYPIDILKLAAHAKSTTKIGSKVGFKLNPVNIELGDSIVMVNSRYAKEAAEIFIKAGYKKATAYAGRASSGQLVIVSPDKKITHVIMGMKVDHSAFEPINATTATLDSSNEFSEFEDAYLSYEADDLSPFEQESFEW